MLMTFQQRAIEAIRADGGRLTAQRQLLLDLLATAGEGIDAERLHQRASQQDPHISLPTVYRTLHTLEAAHLIRSHYTASDHTRKLYRVDDDGATFHFTCRRCGRVLPCQSELINTLKDAIATQLGADITSLCLCAGGLCATCRQETQIP